MTDRELQRLIGMALEAEELERSVSFEHPPLRLAGAGGASGARRWLTGLGFASAAAASLAAALIIMQSRLAPAPMPRLAQHPSAAPNTAPIGATGSAALPNVQLASGTDDQCVLMAVYRNADGQCSCMQLSPHKWDHGRRLADVAPRELVNAALQESCSVNPHQVLVVAVEGKPGSLPHSREDVEAIASKLAEAPAHRADLTSYAYEAIPGLSRDSTVVAERVMVHSGPSLRSMAEELHVPWVLGPDIH